MGRGSSRPSRDPHLSPHSHWLCSAIANMLTPSLSTSSHTLSLPNLASPSPRGLVGSLRGLYSPWSMRVLPKMRGSDAMQIFAKETHTGTPSPSPMLLEKPASVTGPPRCSMPGCSPVSPRQINKFE